MPSRFAGLPLPLCGIASMLLAPCIMLHAACPMPSPEQRSCTPQHRSLAVRITRMASSVHVMFPVVACACPFTYLRDITVTVYVCHQ